MFERLPRLKGPKREIFGSGVFTQIRPEWVGYLGTRPKIPKFWWFRLENCHFVLFSAVADIAKKKLSAVGDSVKKNCAVSPTALNKNTFHTIAKLYSSANF